MQKGISVIICCYNSATRLYETLQHLALQRTAALLPWEIIIVDNASTDDTAAEAQQLWKNLGRNDTGFKIVTEPRPGLSHARECGVAAATFEYIIFCDDDNRLSDNYVQQAFDLITADAAIGALGGICTAVSDIELPPWFSKYEEAYAVGKQALQQGLMNDKGYVIGAGMVTRKSVFQSTINRQLPVILTDRKGNALSTGGDVEYCQRLLLQGYDLYYSEALVFQHFIPAHRLTVSYRDAIFKGVEASQPVLKEYFEATKIKKSGARDKLKLVAAAVKDYGKSCLRRRPPNASAQKIMYYLFNLGFKNRDDLAIIKHFYDRGK
jgi:glycosyltransferase involved in cell wall biosynthesis